MRIPQLFGIRLKLSGSFALVFLLLVAVGRLHDALTVFGIVFLHELAHALAARRYGLGVSEIELTPIGGVARIDGLIEADPAAECGIAVAGPLSNLAMAGAGWALQQVNLLTGPGILFFMYANLALGTFNMLPALPLDGGRIYRALLAGRMGYREATSRAVVLSKAIAVVLFAVGLIGVALRGFSITLVLLAVFIYYTAQREERNALFVLIRYLSGKREELKRSGSMHTAQLVVKPETTLRVIVNRFVPKRYHLVWVVDAHGKVLGMVTETQILDALFDRGMHATILDVL